MTKRHRFVSALAAVLVLCGSTQAEERKYQDLISGSAVPSSFDFNGDGLKAHYVTFAGRSSLGPVHGAFLVEYDFPSVAPNPACPNGTLKLPILVSSSNRAVTGTENQLFLRDETASALFCLNPATGAFTMSLNGIFTGGLGKFAGATGSYEYKGRGQVQLLDKIGMPFGGFVLETEARLVLPNRHPDHD